MKEKNKIVLAVTIFLATVIFVVAGREYGPTVFVGDVSVGFWDAPSNVVHTISDGNGVGTYGQVTNYYKITGTNTKGRVLVSTNVIVEITGAGTSTNSIRLDWDQTGGVKNYIVMVSTNLGVNFDHYWIAGTSPQFIDHGTQGWANGDAETLFTVAPAPSVPWVPNDSPTQTLYSSGEQMISGTDPGLLRDKNGDPVMYVNSRRLLYNTGATAFEWPSAGFLNFGGIGSPVVLGIYSNVYVVGLGGFPIVSIEADHTEYAALYKGTNVAYLVSDQAYVRAAASNDSIQVVSSTNSLTAGAAHIGMDDTDDRIEVTATTNDFNSTVVLIEHDATQESEALNYRTGTNLFLLETGVETGQGAGAQTEVSTTSTTPVSIADTPSTLEAGDYIIFFSAHGHGDTANQQMQYGIYVDGVLQNQSLRELGYDTISTISDIELTMHSQIYLQGLSGGEVVDARFFTDVGTFFVGSRTLIAMKVSK